MKASAIKAQTNRWYYVFNQLKTTVDKWDQNLTTRRQLQQLTDGELNDIGITRTDAEHEARKPFWHE